MYPCFANPQFPCVETMNTAQDDIHVEAWCQNQMFTSVLPLFIDSKTWKMIPEDPQLPAATN